VILTTFCNSEISGLRHHQSRDSELVKTARIPRFRVPGLQSLIVTMSLCAAVWLQFLV